MATQLHNANGQRRRELVKRVEAEEHDCALCDKHVDETLTKRARNCTVTRTPTTPYQPAPTVPSSVK